MPPTCLQVNELTSKQVDEETCEHYSYIRIKSRIIRISFSSSFISDKWVMRCCAVVWWRSEIYCITSSCSILSEMSLLISQSSILLINRAGMPPTTVLAATSLFTTAPAPMTALSPIVTPCRMVALEPTHTFLPKMIGAG